MAVAHHTPAPVLVDQARTPGDEPLDLGLDRLRQHAPGTLAQYRQQRIIGNAHSWPRQPDNAILLHGVSFLVTLNITEDTPPPASATKSSHSSSVFGGARVVIAPLDAAVAEAAAVGRRVLLAGVFQASAVGVLGHALVGEVD